MPFFVCLSVCFVDLKPPENGFTKLTFDSFRKTQKMFTVSVY